MICKSQRIRDPIHGLIVFELDNKTDMMAWRLMQTPEFQRLRRIRQLGVSEFVFPGATHTRFAHSVGVYHNARKLMKIIRRQGGVPNEDRIETVLLAALLHDVGHGPFSHAFEGAREALAERRGVGSIWKHEDFSAAMIEDKTGAIFPILEDRRAGMAREIAELLKKDEPSDYYHAVVSSSFDADRLDYLVRDRYMTGTQSGTIDDDWLLNNLKTQEIAYWQDDDPQPTKIPTFVFTSKAREAAEDFLLARYRLYHQVYLHPVTRGFEKLISGLIEYIGADDTDQKKLGISSDHPLMQFLAGDGQSVENYRRLDDFSVWVAIEQLSRCGDRHAAHLAEMIWNRKPPKTIDVSKAFENDPQGEANAIRRLTEFFAENQHIVYFRDTPSLNLYSDVSGELAKAHKMVRVLDGAGHESDIVQFKDTIIGKRHREKVQLARFYLLDSDTMTQAEKAMRGG